jgi:hypothetical protein
MLGRTANPCRSYCTPRRSEEKGCAGYWIHPSGLWTDSQLGPNRVSRWLIRKRFGAVSSVIEAIIDPWKCRISCAERIPNDRVNLLLRGLSLVSSQTKCAARAFWIRRTRKIHPIMGWISDGSDGGRTRRWHHEKAAWRLSPGRCFVYLVFLLGF